MRECSLSLVCGVVLLLIVQCAMSAMPSACRVVVFRGVLLGALRFGHYYYALHDIASAITLLYMCVVYGLGL